MTAAVAVELVHNFSLLHDDIMDNDTERRHRPTAWTVFGVGAAILAGDALLALAQDLLLEDGNPQGGWAARCLSAAVQRLIGGQGADLAFERREDVTLAECLDMAGDKTAALMACACSIGAVHLGAPPALAMGLAGFGAHVGLAFQLTDDLLGIWGAPEVTGKPVRADLRARKKSLPVVAALNSGTPEAAGLRGLLTSPAPLTEDDLARAADLVVAAGGKDWAESRGRRPARRGQRQPGRHRPGRRRPGRADRDRRVHHGTPVVDDIARQALERARDHALGLQHPDGWWQGELETNVTMDAEDLLLREFLGLHDDAAIAAAARWIRSKQRDDGTWANFYGGPGDLSTTVEAYLALRLAGDEPDAPHMKQARVWILDQGGVEATRVFTRIWLALSGLWSWDELPVIPPELIYMPSWFPLNIYDWGCWARQTIVALAVVQSFRPSRPLGISIDELKTGGPHGRAPGPRRTPDARPLPGARPSAAASRPPPRRLRRPRLRRPRRSADSWSRVFTALDKALHLYRPVKSVRSAALRRCAEWIIARQERDGCWGGIQPPWVYSLMALNLLGYDITHPVMQRGLSGLDRFTITEDTPDGPVRRLEACQSPVWDTVLTMIALADAGLPADHPALASAARWVLGEEIRGPGDWQVRQPDLAPGGWAFEFDNDAYPDTDDTAEVVLALRRWPDPRAREPGRHRAGAHLAGRDAVQGRRLGRVRR